MITEKLSLRREQGQSLVEFSLILALVLVPVMIGILDGGMLFFKYVMITSTAREAARAGAIYQSSSVVPVGQTSCGFVPTVDAERAAYIDQIIDQTMGPLVPYPDPATTVLIEYDHDHDGSFSASESPLITGLNNVCDPYRAGDAVKVTITNDHRAILGLVINLFTPLQLTADAVMVIEPGGAGD